MAQPNITAEQVKAAFARQARGWDFGRRPSLHLRIDPPLSCAPLASDGPMVGIDAVFHQIEAKAERYFDHASNCHRLVITATMPRGEKIELENAPC